MRKEKDVLSEKNVHHRAIAAEGRVRSNGRQHHALHVTKPFAVDEDTATLWERLKRSFPTPEEIQVAGRQVTGFVVPHWAAGVLLAAILGCMGFMYSQISSQRDMLIRLETQLQERDKHELEYREEFKRDTKLHEYQIKNMEQALSNIKVLLTPQQLQVYNRSQNSQQ